MASDDESIDRRHEDEVEWVDQQLVREIITIVVALATQYVPTGLRSMYTDHFRGVQFTAALLDRNSHGGRVKNMTRMSLDTVLELIEWLRLNTDLTESGELNTISIEQKVLIFLYVVTQGVSYRNAAEMFQHSIATISTVFHEVLDALCILYGHVVHIPGEEYSEKALGQDPTRWPFFKGAIGALDGTHLAISIPQAEQSAWRNRKGWISQNVLAACDFKLNFTYIYAGMEGSCHDSRVLGVAEEKDDFAAPPSCYFLADAGYPQRNRSILSPYSGVRYHLKEWAEADKRPSNAKELFNLRHASLRGAVERVFGIFKRRFRIYDRARDGFTKRTQIDLVYALVALHNFMNLHEEMDEDVQDDDEASNLPQPPREYREEPSGNPAREYMIQKRDEIANQMWEAYKAYVEVRREQVQAQR